MEKQTMHLGWRNTTQELGPAGSKAAFAGNVGVSWWTVN